MRFIMTVYKPSGKYYTTEEIDVPDVPLYEIKESEAYKEWENMYPDMFKSCVADPRTKEYRESSLGCVPFLIMPKNIYTERGETKI